MAPADKAQARENVIACRLPTRHGQVNRAWAHQRLRHRAGGSRPPGPRYVPGLDGVTPAMTELPQHATHRQTPRGTRIVALVETARRRTCRTSPPRAPRTAGVRHRRLPPRHRLRREPHGAC
ncbi:hypothetical protein QJS66_19100 [Kocuria rhizophila]|nr:hypothetical protein QJS66_19100 [Kocuria rhizophila]